MRSSRPARSLLIGMFIVAFLLTGCFGSIAGQEQRTYTLAEVGALAQLRFPEGSTVLSTTFQAFQDWHLTAIVTFPADKVEQFAADNELELSEGVRAVTNSSRPDDPDWTPDSSGTVLGFDGSSESGADTQRRLLLDLDHPDTATLYLVAFTM